MSYKKATYILNAILAGLGLAFIIMACNFQESLVTLTIQPSYYPIGISVLLIIFCLISTIETMTKKEDKIIEIRNLKKIGFTILLCVLFGVLWKITKQFYLVSFVCVAVLMYSLDPRAHSIKKILRVLGYTLVLQGIVYLVFQQLMNFRL